MKAVIDRFEGHYAVLLFRDDEVKVDIPKKLLPEGVKEGSWLKVSFELDVEEMKKQEEKIKDLVEKLKKRTNL